MVLFGFGETTIVLTVVLFAIWIIVLDARAGVRGISPSLVEMARSFGASRWQAFTKIYLWAALPEILAGVRLGVIRAVKGVVIGQLLVSVVGFGPLFEIYSSHFLMEHFWALLLRALRLRLRHQRGARLARAPGRLLRRFPKLNSSNQGDNIASHWNSSSPRRRRPSFRSRAAKARFPVHRIYCVGRNYAAHAIEMGGDPDREPPFFFQKNPDNLVLDGGDFPYPPKSNDVHHEIEMVVALTRRRPRHSARDGARLRVYGYGVGLDMTRRDLQGECKKHGPAVGDRQGLRALGALLGAGAGKRDRPSRQRARSGSR